MSDFVIVTDNLSNGANNVVRLTAYRDNEGDLTVALITPDNRKYELAHFLIPGDGTIIPMPARISEGALCYVSPMYVSSNRYLTFERQPRLIDEVEGVSSE